MANVSWILNGDGDWSTAADWSGGAVPGSNDNVTINTTSLHTVTHSTGNDFVLTLTVKNDHFNMTGGSLTIGASASFSTGFNQSGGAFLGSGAVAIAGGATLLGGYAGGALTLTVNGTIALSNYTLGGAASLVNTSTTNQTGQVTVGDNTGVGAKITNQAGATFNIAGDFGLSSGAASAAMVNAGNLAKSAGVGTSVIALSLASTGTLTAQSGTLELDAAADTVGGTLAGAGQIAFGGGYAYTLAAGTVATVAAIDLYNGGTSLTLGGNLSYAGALNETGGTLISLGGHTLTLTGASSLASTIDGTGALATTAGTTTVANFALAGGATWTNSGAVNEIGPVQIGDGLNVSTLTNQASGVYTLASNDGINPGGNPASSLVNAGTLAKTFAGVSYIGVATASTGVINAGVGATIEFTQAGDTFAGTLAGAGQIAFGGGGTNTLAAGTTLSVASLGLYSNATLQLGGNFTYAGAFQDIANATTLNLAGHNLTLTGAASFSSGNYMVVDGGGALNTSAATYVAGLTLGSGVTWNNAGAVTEGATIALGDGLGGAAIVNKAGASFSLVGNQTNINSNNAASILSNSGTIAATASGANNIFVTTNSTGALSAAAGANLYFQVGGNILGGSLTGAGQIAVVGNGSATLSAKTMTVSAFGVYNNGQVGLGRNITYKGAFNVNGSGTAVFFNGYSLTLSSLGVFYEDYNNPYLGGPGVLNTTGQAGIYGVTLGGGLVWNNRGAVNQANHNVQVDDAGTTINNQVGGTWNINGDLAIVRNAATTTAFNNAGTLAKIAGGGNSYINLNVDNTGTIDVGGGEIEIAGITNTLGGTITGAGALGIGGGGSTTIAAGTSLGSSVTITDNGTSVTLGGDETIGGGFADGYGTYVNLNGFTLTADNGASFYNGNYEDPTIGGTGAFVTTGATAINALVIGGTVTWTNSGVITITNGPLQIGDGGTGAATLNNAASGSVLLANDAQIQRGAVSANLVVNAGLLAKTGGTGTSTVSSDVTSTGTISCASGNLAFAGPSNSIAGMVTGAGLVSFSGGNTTLAAGMAMTAAAWDIYNDGTSVTLGGALSYAGAFNEYNGTVFNLAGHSLTFTGSVGIFYANYGTPTFNGGGTLNTHGATAIGSFVLGGGVNWNNYGAVTVNGSFQIGDSGPSASTVVNKVGASVLIEADQGPPTIGSGLTVGSTFINDGTLGKIGGGGGLGGYHSRVAVGVTNAGVIEAYSGDFEFQGAVTGAGTAIIDNGAALQLDSAVSAGQSIGFGAGGGTLYLGDATAFSGGLSSFGSNCAIDLGGFGYNPPTETITVTSTEITVTDGSKVANIQLFAQFSAGFHIANDGGGGTLILAGSGGAPKPPALMKPHHA